MEETLVAQETEVKKASPLKGWFGPIVIVLSIVFGWIIYLFIMGAPSNFEGGDPENGHPVAEGFARWLGLFYKGGQVVPFAIGLLLMVITASIERMVSLGRASGKGNLDMFVARVQTHLENNNLQAALDECDRAQGSVGNVTREVLLKYGQVEKELHMDKEQKMVAIQKALEESIALELPVLQRNMVIISTIVSVATLTALLGTVLGMIRAFASLGASGAADAAQLSVGISEALVN
ncbi:MAG: MotA/TolQ/ExbB proton channel family protein, partial [Sphingobacteriia bacterium]